MEDLKNYKGTEEILQLVIEIRITDLMSIIQRAILPEAKGPEVFRAALPANRVIRVLKELSAQPKDSADKCYLCSTLKEEDRHTNKCYECGRDFNG